MKKIVVELKGSLNKYLAREESDVYEVPDKATINCLLSSLGLESCYIGAVLQNDELSKLDDTILDDAIIKFYPVFGGG